MGYENQKIKPCPNYRKASWTRFRKDVMESLAAEEVPSKKLFIFTEASKEAASMTVPLRVFRTNETPYMNDEIKCLMKERNRPPRNLPLNLTAGLQKCKKVAEKVEEAKRMSWRNHLDWIKGKKNVQQKHSSAPIRLKKQC